MAKNQFITGPVSYGGKAQQLAIGAGVAKAFSSGGYDSLRRDYLQDQLINQELNEFKSVYKKINTIPETGVETFDTNINAFFNQGADKIFKVKDLMANGHMTQQEGAKIIAQTEDYIDKYNLLAPKIIEQIKYYRDSKSTNKISRVNDDGLSAMLDAIANNAGGIELLEKDGKMYLTGSGKVGDQDWKYNMNLDELGGLLGQEGFAMVKTIPTYEELGLDSLFDAQKGLLKGATDTYEYEDSQGNIKTKQVYNPEKLGELMVQRGLFAELINDPEMEVVWSDMVNADKELGSFEQWNPANKDMRQTMEAFLIDKAITRNIPADEIINVREQKTSSGGGGGGLGFGASAYNQILGMLDESVRDATSPGQFSKLSINLDDAARYMTIMGDKNIEFFSLENPDNLNKIVAKMDDNDIKEPRDVQNLLKEKGFDDYGNLIAFIDADGELDVIKGFDGTVMGMLGSLKKFGGLGSKEKTELNQIINNIDTFGGDIQKFRDWYDLNAADQEVMDNMADQELFNIYLNQPNIGPTTPKK